jgi:YHS domain-containing protein
MRLLIIALVIYFLYRIIRKKFDVSIDLRKEDPKNAIDEMVQDPVCRTYVPLRDAHRRVIQGKEYFFCSPACADRYEKG